MIEAAVSVVSVELSAPMRSKYVFCLVALGMVWLGVPALQILDCLGQKRSTWREGPFSKEEGDSEYIQQQIFECPGFCNEM